MSQKVALITGAGRRIGRAIAEALARRQYHIAIHCLRNLADAQTLAKHLLRRDVKTTVLSGDLGDDHTAYELVQQTIERLGRLDVLINNASIWQPNMLLEMSHASLRQNLTVNMYAPLALSRAFAASQPRGVVVNLLDCRIRDYDYLHASYHLSKRALRNATRLLALELAPGFRVNGVAPGLILPPDGSDETYLHARCHTNPLQTVGNVSDIAKAVVFLSQTPSVTGQVIYVDGGRNMAHAVY